MRFCVNCKNMLYLQLENATSNTLVYYCRVCEYKDTEDLDYVNVGHSVLSTQFKKGEQRFNHIINRYTKLDPTLPRIYNMKCPRLECKTNEQATSSKEETSEKGPKETEIIYMRYDDDKMKYLYICAECDHVW
jgi:DNA-directed RNA polymerase subunit M/transcription elongation factor TFIIS